MAKGDSSKQSLLLDYLASPPAGIFSRPFDIYARGERPRISISRIRANLTRLAMPSGIHCAPKVQAGGTGLTHEDAHLPAISEALERYCTSVYSENQFLLASAANMEWNCVDLDSVPRCSATELAHPRCPLIAPSKETPIRWVKGVELTGKEIRYVPAIMVYSHLREVLPAERFWFPISTGCAAHFDLNKALINAIFEVIERDAISVTWLRELHLPKIVIDKIPAELAQHWDLYLNSSSTVKYDFYNATTDLGIPTVYGLRIAPYSEHARTLVACSTASTTAEAMRKVLCDLISLSTVFKRPLEHPDRPEDCRDLTHGAAYMAHAKHEESFNFLRQNGREVK